MYAFFSALVVVVTIAALVDIIRRDGSQMKHLPKIAWVLLVVFMPLIGSALWFALGREWDRRPREAIGFGDPRRWARASEPEIAPPPRDSRSTEQQLADLEAEIAYYDRMRERKQAQPPVE
jgi:hypothetical protein